MNYQGWPLECVLDILEISFMFLNFFLIYIYLNYCLDFILPSWNLFVWMILFASVVILYSFYLIVQILHFKCFYLVPFQSSWCIFFHIFDFHFQFSVTFLLKNLLEVWETPIKLPIFFKFSFLIFYFSKIPIFMIINFLESIWSLGLFFFFEEVTPWFLPQTHWLSLAFQVPL